MAEVLQIPRTPDGPSMYQSTGLRRSHASSSSLFMGSPALSSSPKSSTPGPPAEHQENISTSPPMSPSTYTPPPSTLSLDSTSTNNATPLEQKYGNDDDVGFPDYGGVQFYQQHDDFEGASSSDEPAASTTTETTASDSPLPTPTVLDDTAMKQEPKQHVDYLSHDWREEDIWSSWRHIVSQRKVYGQKSRLENASWRTWAKSKYHLRTVSPETLNWLKESDVTWLYGPLKPAETHPITSNMSEPASRLSKSNSFINKKPILKKRSMSEVMLQKSISASSLLKQAAAAVQAQQGKQARSHTFRRAQSDFTASTANSEVPSRDQIDYFTSRSSSDSCTPCECQAKRHIRFDDKVEQCIAVECKEDPEDDADSEPEDDSHEHETSESSSDDGVIMMKRKKRPSRKKAGWKTGSRSNSHNGRKTIETLPATTLKYRTDSLDVSEAQQQQQQQHAFGAGQRNWSAGKMSPSPSQETLRPSRPSSNFLIGDEDEGGELDMSSSWSFGSSNPKSSLGASAPAPEPSSSSKFHNRRDSVAVTRARSGLSPSNPEDNDYEFSGALRRTGSGMLMPYEDDEDDMMAVGLFGRVSETINTAKDIAHVIWNVGWRK